MSDRRFGPTRSRQIHAALDLGANELDNLVASESPQVQELRLYRELGREIEKHSNDRLRYADSQIYAKVRERSPMASSSSEKQSGFVLDATDQLKSRVGSSEKHSCLSSKERERAKSAIVDDGNAMDIGEPKTGEQRAFAMDGNCQVCLVKNLKNDLTNITKVIQERNEQLVSKLKAKQMRSFFERQMLD